MMMSSDFGDGITKIGDFIGYPARSLKLRYDCNFCHMKMVDPSLTPFHYKDVFIYDESLRNYIRFLTGGAVGRRLDDAF